MPDHHVQTTPVVFQAERPRLLGLAYRLVGSRADAEDVVQEAWLRWSAADQPTVANPPGWLTTVTTRLAIDRLRQLERRREAYVGPWLPEPISIERTPEEHSELAESLTLGFLVVLDKLAPVERAVLLLADVFAEPYAVISAAVGKSEAACRQIASRARRKVRADAGPSARPPVPFPGAASAEPARLEHQVASAELLAGLLAALSTGDEARVVQLLDPEVVLVTDAGPNRHAARRPVLGSYRVGRLLTNLTRRLGTVPTRVTTVNAGPALVVDVPGGPIVVCGEARQGLVTRIWVQLNPEKLAALDQPLDLR
jgi:RNA polymerase sigma-70 factor (ECF subfamily)